MNGFREPQLQVLSPLNDLQLIVLVAAQDQHSEPADAVAKAIELIAEAVVQQPKLSEVIRTKVRRIQE